MDAQRKPLARSDSLVVEELGDEVLVYDLDDDNVHCLTPMVARVWRAADGLKGVDRLAAELDLTGDEVSQALTELERCRLIETAPTLSLAANENGGYSRRDFGLRVAKVAAATASAPLIVSIAAPTAAQAQTPCVDLPFTGNCGVCNQLTGSNTVCCCCHNPSPFICTDSPEECCALPGATHCTEGAGRPVICRNTARETSRESQSTLQTQQSSSPSSATSSGSPSTPTQPSAPAPSDPLAPAPEAPPATGTTTTTTTTTTGTETAAPPSP